MYYNNNYYGYMGGGYNPNPYGLNFSRSYPRVVVYNGQQNFEMPKWLKHAGLASALLVGGGLGSCAYNSTRVSGANITPPVWNAPENPGLREVTKDEKIPTPEEFQTKLDAIRSQARSMIQETRSRQRSR